MKRNLYFSLFGFLAAVALCSLTAPAQNLKDVWEVPFVFSVNNATLPAGQYIVQNGPVYCRLTTREGDKSVHFLPIPGSPNPKKAKATLVFRKYGQELFLAKIYTLAGSNCLEVLESRREKEVAAQLKIATGQSYQPIEIASHR